MERAIAAGADNDFDPRLNGLLSEAVGVSWTHGELDVRLLSRRPQKLADLAGALRPHAPSGRRIDDDEKRLHEGLWDLRSARQACEPFALHRRGIIPGLCLIVECVCEGGLTVFRATVFAFDHLWGSQLGCAA